MEFKTIKILFYAFFTADIIAGLLVGFYLGILAGIITAVVLLSINITVYAIILKIQKIKEQSSGYTKKSGSL
jgi:hypothetical protein